MFLLLFVVHNCTNKKINVSYVTKRDFFINIFLFVIQNFEFNQAIKVASSHEKMFIKMMSLFKCHLKSTMNYKHFAL